MICSMALLVTWNGLASQRAPLRYTQNLSPTWEELPFKAAINSSPYEAMTVSHNFITWH